MAVITAQAYSQGADIAFTAAAGAGDEVVHATRQKLLVLNSGSVDCDVTIASEVTSAPPIGPADLVVTVPPGQLGVIDISDRNFKDVDGNVNWTYESETDITVAVVSGI